MGVWTDRLNFMAETRSIASISRETGVPYRLLLGVRRGADLPSGMAGNLTPLYRKVTYQRLVEVGTPTQSASALRGAGMETIKSTMSGMIAKVNAWARGATLSHFAKKRLMLGNPQVKAYYEKMQEKVRSALNEATTSASDILNDRYGKGSTTR